MSTVSSTSGLSGLDLYSILSSAYATTDSSSTATTAVKSTTDSALVSEAVSLSSQSEILASLVSSGNQNSLTYDAASLLNALIDAKTASNNTDSSSNSSMTDSGASTISNSWSSVLQNNPDLAAAAVASAYNQGIVSNLLATA